MAKKRSEKAVILTRNVFLSYPRTESSSDCSSTRRCKHFLSKVSTKERVVKVGWSKSFGAVRSLRVCVHYHKLVNTSWLLSCTINIMFPLFDCWILLCRSEILNAMIVSSEEWRILWLGYGHAKSGPYLLIRGTEHTFRSLYSVIFCSIDFPKNYELLVARSIAIASL